MTITTRTVMPVAAGDLIFCRSAGRAGFASRSAGQGEDVDMVDEGSFLVTISGSEALTEGAALSMSDTGAIIVGEGDRPVGVIETVSDVAFRSVQVRLNSKG